MTRGSNRKLVESWKNVANFLCTRVLVNQLYMVTTSLLTCTIQDALVATSPSGGERLPPVVCDSLVLPTCVYSVTPAAGGGAAPLCGHAAPTFDAAAFLAAR